VKSEAKPPTSSEILVPVEVGAKIKNEPAKTEHAGLFGLNVVEQVVLITPGPTVMRFSKAPPIVIKPALLVAGEP
jgi:hypothetical protein